MVPLYIAEQFSDAAGSALRPAGQPPFTSLHQLEVPNAFERLVGHGLMTREEWRLVQQQLQDDLDKQRLIPVSVDLDHVFTHARELSKLYAATCTRFVSADDRQLAVAKASGLRITDIKRSVRRRKR